MLVGSIPVLERANQGGSCGRSIRGRPDCATLAGMAPLTAEELRLIDAYWRAANYLSVGQIYLLDNPLLREPLRLEHVKPRLLGHWGTTPGLNLLYAHMNRAIRQRDLNAIYVTGPGHGGPGLVANTYLEGTYSEVYPHIGEDEEGIAPAVPAVLVPRRHSVATWPPRRPARSTRAASSATRSCMPTARSSTTRICSSPVRHRRRRGRDRPARRELALEQVREPGARRRRAAVLHLNGYKIANPTVLARIPHEELRALLEGYGHEPLFVEGDDPARVHQALAAALDCVARRASRRSRSGHGAGDARAPALADDRASDSEGLDGPEGGRRPAGRGHVPRAPGAACRACGESGAPPPARGVDALVPARGAVRRRRSAAGRAARAAPRGERRMGANPHANGGAPAARPRAARLPRLCRRCG